MVDVYKKFNDLTEEFIYFLSDKLTEQSDIDLLQKLNMDLVEIKSMNYTVPFTLFYKGIYQTYGTDLEKDTCKICNDQYINKIRKTVGNDTIIVPLIQLVKSYPEELVRMVKTSLDLCKEKIKLDKKK
jgi:hypothetical protein